MSFHQRINQIVSLSCFDNGELDPIRLEKFPIHCRLPFAYINPKYHISLLLCLYL